MQHPSKLILSEVTSPAERRHVETFIQANFLQHFEAQVVVDAPRLFGAYRGNGDLVAAFGTRDETEGFFSQTYLAQPVRSMLSPNLRAGTIAEVTNLCVDRVRTMVQFMPLVGAELHRRGVDVVLCTVTDCLARYFHCKRWQTEILGQATPQHLAPDQRARWGIYYESNPCVIAGSVDAAIAVARGGAHGH